MSGGNFPKILNTGTKQQMSSMHEAAAVLFLGQRESHM
jgi:hypothetical protein